ncbi:MAG: hypothetical protein ACRDJE_16715 [Dehalococcoidia bacterium]
MLGRSGTKMRRFWVIGIVVALLVAACGGGGGDEKDAAPAAQATRAGATTPRGELRLAFGIHMPASLDATKDGFSLVFAGAGETLTRLTREQVVEPWLAESVTQIDPHTWRVVIRPNATF